MLHLIQKNRKKLNLIGFIVGLFISFNLWYITHYVIELKNNLRFTSDTREVIRLLELKTKLYENSIKSLKGVYTINKETFKFLEFQKYNSLLFSSFNSCVGIGFYKYIVQKEVNYFENEVKNHSGTDNPIYTHFKIDPKQIQEYNLLVQYAFPFDTFSNAIGKNILKLPNRQVSIEYALKHDLAITHLINLLGEKPRKAILLFTPIFDAEKTKNLDMSDPKNRTFENLYGFVSIGFDVNQLFKYVLSNNVLNNISVKVTDVVEKNGIIEYQQELFNSEFSSNQNLYHKHIYDYGGRKWIVEFQAKDNYISNVFYILPYVIGFFGFFITFLIIQLYYTNLKISHKNQMLNESEERFKNIIQTSPMAFFMTELSSSKILMLNQKALEIFNIPELEYKNNDKKFYMINYCKHDILRKNLIEQLKIMKSLQDVEICFNKENGEEFWGLVSMTLGVYHGIDVILINIHDITKRKANEEQLKFLATTDFLTGLNNRRHFLELANNTLSKALKHRLNFSVMMLDIDKFKNINDTYGHDIGDKAIQQLAIVCKQNLRDNDIIGRLGGEEFAVILPNTDINSALKIAENLRQKMSEQFVSDESKNIHFAYTVSIGVSGIECVGCFENAKCFGCKKPFEQQLDMIDKLLKLADEALYQAKTNGRNQVCLGKAN